MNNTYFSIVFTSFENILEKESNECLTGEREREREEMLHVLITHVQDYLIEKKRRNFFFDRRTRREREREEEQKEKKKQIHKPQKYKEHLLRINFTHTTTLSTSPMCFPLFSCVSSDHQITSSICHIFAFTSRQFFNSISSFSRERDLLTLFIRQSKEKC